MNADAAIHAGLFDGQEALGRPLDTARLACVHLARGELVVNGKPLSGGEAQLMLRARPVGRGAGV